MCLLPLGSPALDSLYTESHTKGGILHLDPLTERNVFKVHLGWSVFDYGYLGGCEVVTCCGFDCLSVMTEHNEHLLSCSLIICISHSGEYVFFFKEFIHVLGCVGSYLWHKGSVLHHVGSFHAAPGPSSWGARVQWLQQMGSMVVARGLSGSTYVGS